MVCGFLKWNRPSPAHLPPGSPEGLFGEQLFLWNLSVTCVTNLGLAQSCLSPAKPQHQKCAHDSESIAALGRELKLPGPLLFCVSESSFLNLCHLYDPDWLLGVEKGACEDCACQTGTLQAVRQCRQDHRDPEHFGERALRLMLWQSPDHK